MKKTLSILFAFVFLVSQLGFTMGTHFCGGDMVKSSLVIFGHVDIGCGMEEDISCEEIEHPSHQLDNEQCCKDIYQTFQSDEEIEIDYSQTSINDIIAILFYFISNQFDSSNPTNPTYSDYSPPPLESDVIVLFQSFLI